MPDLYQGDELPLRALVDPDNRRPVDWGWYDATMDKLQGGAPPSEDTRKLWTCAQLLGLRIRRPQAFGVDGGYAPVDAGPGVVAFTRGSGADAVLVVVGVRHEAAGELAGIGGQWVEVLGGGSISLERPVDLGGLLAEHGCAVLKRIA
jgi:(1->4)-alpha-D-glucan 1-alpha-D-glucosylmutase